MKLMSQYDKTGRLIVPSFSKEVAFEVRHDQKPHALEAKLAAVEMASCILHLYGHLSIIACSPMLGCSRTLPAFTAQHVPPSATLRLTTRQRPSQTALPGPPLIATCLSTMTSTLRRRGWQRPPARRS